MEWTEEALRWKRLFEECRSSGSSRKEFCTERGLTVSTFDYWRGRLRKTSAESGALVKVGSVPTPQRPKMRIRLSEQVVIEADGAVEEEQLVSILRAAAQA